LIKIIKIELSAKTTVIDNIPELLRHIASMVEEGFLSSDNPVWELEIRDSLESEIT